MKEQGAIPKVLKLIVDMYSENMSIGWVLAVIKQKWVDIQAIAKRSGTTFPSLRRCWGIVKPWEMSCQITFDGKTCFSDFQYVLLTAEGANGVSSKQAPSTQTTTTQIYIA